MYSAPPAAPTQMMGGGAYYGGGDAGVLPNQVVLQMGLRYGQSILQQGVQQGERGLLHYMPFFHALRAYFAVDNRYVTRKLALLLFPFRRRYPRVGEGAAAAAAAAGSGGSDAFIMTDAADASEQAAYGSPLYAGSPTTTTAAAYGAHGVAHRGAAAAATSTAAAATRALPLHDHFAFDLYIPLMAAITYVTLCAFLRGTLHHHRVTAEDLLATTTVLTMWCVAEVLALRLLAYALPLAPRLALLDLLALSGYKYVHVCVVALVHHVLRASSRRVAAVAVLGYAVGAYAYFVVRGVARLYEHGDGHVPPRARLLAYLAALAQAPAFVWMSVRTFRL